MADVEDLIDFNVIETQKENIQSLPGGRSAKNLSLLCSPISLEKSVNLSETQNAKQAVRQTFENELANIADADDPLDIYNRYINWTTDAYPSAQATTESQLLPLLERATKSFLTTTHYKNDARYLKIWLLYIRLFSDTPRETYAFLARHGVGENLALFYEEYAAWLEQAGRWTQAEEVYGAGVDKEARPTERLLRKYAEFQQRREERGMQDSDGPSSPALPKVRPALAAKVDPFASASTPDRHDPQARDRAAAEISKPKSGRSKLTIFADEDEQPKALGAGGPQGWDSIGSINDRKKENVREARPWAGETLNGGKKLGGPKMMVFKDEASTSISNEKEDSKYSKLTERCTVNPKTGRKECVFVDLESIYPTGDEKSGVEFCFEELRARRRGWLDMNWSKQRKTNPVDRPGSADSKQSDNSPSNRKAPSSSAALLAQSLEKLVPLQDENTSAAALQQKSAKKARKADRDNRTRRIRVMEVRAETQTIQTNLTSPSGPKLKKKKSAEPTMTFHTKEAMNEVYDIFNQTLTKVPDEEEPAESEDDSDDDYTSAGESTGTGRISGHTSEYDTDGEYTGKTSADETGGGISAPSGFSAFSAAKTGDDATLSDDEDDEDDDDITRSTTRTTTQDLSVKSAFSTEASSALITPRSPTPAAALSPSNPWANEASSPSAAPQAPRPRPRAQKASTRLPPMTPIVEKTESSLGALTAAGRDRAHDRSASPAHAAGPKTPSRRPNAAAASPWSSPFDALGAKPIAVDAAPRARPPPFAPVQHGAASCTAAASSAAPTKPAGPAVADAQCNPLDAGVRATILGALRPPLATYAGYVEHGGPSGRAAEMRRFVGRQSGARGPAPVVRLAGAHRAYALRRELGRGAFAPVYLVESLEGAPGGGEERGDDGAFKKPRGLLEAVKMEEPPSAWEFYVLRAAKRRLGVGRAAESIVDAHEMHMFSDECFLVEEYRGQGTLLDLVNVSRAENGGGMDEMLAMFFAVEMLRTVEALHSKGIIHGDLKADNVLVRFDQPPSSSSLSSSLSVDSAWSAQFCKDGRDGWSSKGVTLIDFGRGIDMRAFRPDVQFIADWKTSEADCAEMREMRPWTYQIDYHGLAGVVHSLLFGKYLETIAERGGALGAGASKTYRIREGLKRYWQQDIWSDLFDMLLNTGRHLECEEGKKLPLLVGMKSLRVRMEEYLEANCEKGVGLKGMIRRMENAIRERKK